MGYYLVCIALLLIVFLGAVTAFLPIGIVRAIAEHFRAKREERTPEHELSNDIVSSVNKAIKKERKKHE